MQYTERALRAAILHSRWRNDDAAESVHAVGRQGAECGDTSEELGRRCFLGLCGDDACERDAAQRRDSRSQRQRGCVLHRRQSHGYRRTEGDRRCDTTLSDPMLSTSAFCVQSVSNLCPISLCGATYRSSLRGPRTFGGKTPDRGALQITDLQPRGDWAVGLLDDPGRFQAYLRSKTGKRRYRDIKETSLLGSACFWCQNRR